MRNIIPALVLLMSSAAFAQAPNAPDVVGVGNFSHVVRDMDRAVAFYRDVLGLEVGASQPFSPNPAIMRLGNTPGAQSKMVQLRVPGSTMGVELLEYKDIERRVQTPRFFDPGAANMALRVRDLAPILAKLPGSGAKIITEGGQPATVNNGKFVFLQDPDGFVVELAQTAPPADAQVPPTGNVFGGSFELTVNDSEQSVKFYKDMLGIDMPLGLWHDAHFALRIWTTSRWKRTVVVVGLWASIGCNQGAQMTISMTAAATPITRMHLIAVPAA